MKIDDCTYKRRTKNRRLDIRLEEEMLIGLKILAKRNFKSESEIIRTLLLKELKRKNIYAENIINEKIYQGQVEDMLFEPESEKELRLNYA
jgi:hypothetical protein